MKIQQSNGLLKSGILLDIMRLENFKKLFPMLHVSKYEMDTSGKRYLNSAIPKMLRLLNKE